MGKSCKKSAAQHGMKPTPLRGGCIGVRFSFVEHIVMRGLLHGPRRGLCQPLGGDEVVQIESSLNQLRIRKWLVICLLGLALVVLLPNLLVVKDEPDSAHAIIVIGGDHKPARVQQAAELYRQGYAPIIVISAGALVQEGSEWMTEAEVMRRQILQLGLPEEVLIIEDRSLSTVQNARYSGEVCKEHGIKSILLVTSAYHSRRARHIFRRELERQMSVQAQPAPRKHHPLLWWLYPDQAYTVLYEYKNWVQYWLGMSH